MGAAFWVAVATCLGYRELRVEDTLEVLAGIRAAVAHDLFRSAGGNHFAALIPAFRAEVDDVIGGLEYVEVVLDDDHGIPGIDQAMQNIQQPLDVGEVQASGRFIEDIEGLARVTPAEFFGELDPLRLATRQLGRRLSKPDIAKADLTERLQLALDLRDAVEKRGRLLDAHVEHVGDRFAAIGDLERLFVVALALADFAGHVDVRQEMHLDLDDAVPLTVLAAATLDVEAEPARLVAAHLRLGHFGEQLADIGEDAGVGGRVRPGRPADRRLVDIDHLVDEAQAGNLAGGAGAVFGAIEVLRQAPVQNVADQRALARAADPGHADQFAQRKVHVNVLQVVFSGSADDEHLPVALAAPRRQWDRSLAAQERPGDRLGRFQDIVERAGGDDLPAVLAGAGADVDDEVGRPHRLFVVLDDDHRVADVSQRQQRGDQLSIVALVQPDRRLIEDVQDTHQLGADLGGE